MKGAGSGTDGGQSGTSGVIPARLYLFCLAVCLAFGAVNVSSILIEDPPGQRDFAVWEPYCWEISSAVAFAVLLPGLYAMYRRFHWSRFRLGQFLLAQGVAWLAYVMAHTAIMVAQRHLVYGLMGGRYDFSHGNLALQLIYEGRKDALTCTLMAGIFWVYERTRPSPVAPQTPERFEVSSEGLTLYLDPAEIVRVEAAGNYVEMFTAGTAKPRLLRGTLNDFEQRLKPFGLIRIHRSRLLNPAHIKGHAATPSGDLRILLGGGDEVIASRRYRNALDL